MSFEVSSCTKFQILQGSAPEPAGGTYSIRQTSGWLGRGLAVPLQEPHSPLGFTPSLWRIKFCRLPLPPQKKYKFGLTPLNISCNCGLVTDAELYAIIMPTKRATTTTLKLATSPARNLADLISIKLCTYNIIYVNLQLAANHSVQSNQRYQPTWVVQLLAEWMRPWCQASRTWHRPFPCKFYCSCNRVSCKLHV